jgi:beta-lactamase class A
MAFRETLSLTIVLFAAALLAGFPAQAAPATLQRPGIEAAADLWQSADPRLQAGLDGAVRNLGLTSAARRGRLALALADITDLRKPRVAAVNGDTMMYAASLPKIAILLGAYHKSQLESLAFPPALKADVVQMIRYSANDSATRVLDWVGRERLLDLLQSPTLRLYDPARNGGLWVGKDYAAGPAFRRDPLHGISHGATAMQVVRLFYLLEAGQLLDPEHTRGMKAALAKPGITHKFVKGLTSRPEARIYRKSGTWKQFHADGALVESGGRRLIMVGLASDPRGGQWLVDLATPLHDLVVPGAAARQRPVIAAASAR